MWNKFEDLNNKLYLFPILLNLIKQKRHTYTIKDEKSFKKYDDFTMVDVIDAEDISEEEYEKLLEKQNRGILQQSERLSMEKYMYAKIFNVKYKDIDGTFMRTHYGKIKVVFNNKLFIKYFNEGEKVIVLDKN